MKKPRKGDRITYIGSYAPGVMSRYSAGTVVGFRRNGTLAIVQLDGGNFADWPVDQVEPAS